MRSIAEKYGLDITDEKSNEIIANMLDRIKEHTYDISTFLTRVIALRLPKGRVERVVTYHDSCHLKKTMKVFAEPREILKSIPGITFKEMTAPDTCCGSGGSYVLSHYDTASTIGRKKLHGTKKIACLGRDSLCDLPNDPS